MPYPISSFFSRLNYAVTNKFDNKFSILQPKYIIILMLFASIYSCKSQELETVPSVDLQKYSGLWYDIAHLPFYFMKDCECTTAKYTYSTKGYVIVENRCRKSTSGKWKSAKGKAFVVNNSRNAKLKVQFFWPFKGDYWIIDLDEDYTYAVVGDKARKYLWILSRTSQMEKKLYDEIVIRTGNKGFPVEHLIISKQSGCE